jgi:lysophospholipase L1-like esterase
LQPGDHYVALGSSIASGFGISTQSTACGRSSRDYGQLVAQHFKLKLTDVTCGGAVVPNVVDTPQGNFPPQLQAVTPDTKLVTVTVGGNDIEYNASAVTCADPSYVCKAPPNLAALLAKDRVDLKHMIDKIKAAAPSATIVFVTYPREVGPGNCPAYSLVDSEAAVLRMMGAQLEQAFVDVVKPTGVVFVDPYVAPGDHTACAVPSQRWVNGSTVAPGAGFKFHPTALGHQMMAAMIIKALGT